MNDQQFGNSGDEEVPPVTNTPPWIVTPPSDPPPWLISEPPRSAAPPWPQTPAAPSRAPTPDEMPWPDPPSWAPPTSGQPAWIVSEAPPGQSSSPPSEQPAWIVSEATSEQPSGPGRNRRPLIVAAAVLVVLIVAGGGGWFFTHRDKTPGAGPSVIPATVVPAPDPTTLPTTEYPTEDATTTYPTDEPTATEEPTTVETTPVADPQQDALSRLDQISAQDLGAVTFDGRYVAQVASKNPGTYDRFQSTANGSHTFQATDILAEYQQLRDDLGGSRVVLLKSTDFGKHQLYHGAPLYVTFYLGHFGSAAAVRSWCASTFPNLSSDALADQCAVRKMH
jgi:hypothetical protein